MPDPVTPPAEMMTERDVELLREDVARSESREDRDYEANWEHLRGVLLTRACAERILATHAALAEARTENERLAQREREALDAHAASFGALAAISQLTDLGGEVDDYGDVVKAVERLTGGQP